MGQTATNVTLYDCDGNPVELHSLCRHRVAHVYTFAEWCPSCRTFVRDQLEVKHGQYAAMGDLATWVVVTAVTSGALDATGCRRIRDSYGIDTPGITVLFDPAGQTNSVLGMFPNANDLVMARHNRVVINARYSGEIGLQQAFASTTP
ncbi:MAG: hypothetical protein DRJ42_31190 [Deltaproteobacteria bacterium]|nr:MAG: hypothetical protein DRJ42_31190 [Deltaproteobacteria bacterium]